MLYVWLIHHVHVQSTYVYDQPLPVKMACLPTLSCVCVLLLLDVFLLLLIALLLDFLLWLFQLNFSELHPIMQQQ